MSETEAGALSSAQRQQIWALLEHQEPATQRQGVELLAALGDEAQGAMIYRGMDGQQFQALGSLVRKNPDVPLQWLKTGYQGIAVKPFDGFQFRLMELLSEGTEKYNARLLKYSDEDWEALDYSARFDEVEAIDAELKALAQSLIEDAGGLAEAMPADAAETRFKEWYQWVQPSEVGSKDADWLRTREHLRGWLGEDADTPKGADALTFMRSLPEAVRHEVLRPVMINEWNRPIVCFRASFQGVLIELLCENQDLICQYANGSFYRVKDLESLDLTPYTDRAYCSVTGRAPTPNELKALATLPCLDSIRFNYQEGMDLSPLMKSPMLTMIEINSGADQETLDGIDLGDITILVADSEDPEYGREELYDENGDFNLELHTCEVCGKVADEWSMCRYDDSTLTQNTEDNFHCEACQGQLVGACVDCGSDAPSAFLEFETFAEGPLGLEEREGWTSVQRCGDCS